MIIPIILAAGEARRMGQPKQLMELQGQSLLRRVVQTARSAASEIIVVTGAYSEEIRKDLQGSRVRFAHNPDWKSGMGSSIRTGLQQALAFNPDAVLILLCDQPLVSSALLQQIIQRYQETQRSLVASAYRDTTGVPALFDKGLFPKLLELDGKVGAKQIIARHSAQMSTVAFPEGIYDIDTPEDFARIRDRLMNL